MTQLRDVRRQSSRVVCEATAMNINTNLLLNRHAAPFDNPDIRRALALALDRREFVASLDSGSGLIGGHLYPPPAGQWGMPTEILAEVPGYGSDPGKNREEARALMRSAGFGPDKPLQVKILTRAISPYRNPVTLLASQLREIYVESTVDVVETTYWYIRLRRGDHAIAIETTGNGIDDPDQVFYESFSCRSERNYSRYCNPEMERLFEVQSSELDVEKRRQLAWDIDARLLADGVRLPLAWWQAATCWQPHVHGFAPQTIGASNGFRFEDVWMERR